MEWKECKFCNSYLISNYGDIKHKKTNKIRKQKLNKHNYLEITISMGDRKHIAHKQVHRLVAETFIPNPENKPQVNHINGIKTDNRVENLEWVTAKENVQHARKIGLKLDDKGENSPNSKMTKEQVKWCRNVYKPKDKKYGCKALAEMFTISKSAMWYILNNVTYKE